MTSKTRLQIAVGVIVFFIVIVTGSMIVQRVFEAQGIPSTAVASRQVFGGIPFVYVQEGDFWIMETEVTNAMYQRFMDADGYRNNEYWDDPAGWQWREDNGVATPRYWDGSNFNGPKQPVAGVNRYEAEAFANWLSTETGLAMRLPDDEEWGLACSGTDGRTYPWGNEPLPSEALLNYSDIVGSTTDVGSYPDGVSPYGALDMAGNVWEWTGESSLRGGSWDYDEGGVRCAYRGSGYSGFGGDDGGFRVLSPGS